MEKSFVMVKPGFANNPLVISHNMTENVIHASDCVEAGVRETAIFKTL